MKMDLKFHRCKRKAQNFHLFSFLYLTYLFTFPYPLNYVQIDIEGSIHAERKKSDSDIVFPMEDIKSFKKDTEKPMKTAFTKPSEEEKTKDDDEKQYSIRFLILDYFEYTSGHGPPRILASRQLVRKIFWTLLFLAALGVSSWQIATLFETYKSRPLSTHVAIQHETVRESVLAPTIAIASDEL